MLNVLRPSVLCAVLIGVVAPPHSDHPAVPPEPSFELVYTVVQDTTVKPRPDTAAPPLLGPSLRYGLDTTVSPCVDFYQYVNGGWRTRAKVGTTDPTKKTYFGSFHDTYSRAQKRLQVILDSALRTASTTNDPAFKALGTFYGSCLASDSLEPAQKRVKHDTTPVPDSTRANRCLQRTIQNLGGALGQTFAKDLLVSDARMRMEQIVEALRVAVIARLETNRWMTADERALALHRFGQLNLRIGLPTKMDDYSGLTLSTTDYFENKKRLKNFENVQLIRSIGGSRRDQWMMSLLTPNAQYIAGQHSVEIPAVMFLPPFFDAKGEDAVNFAGVAYVIGHEIFHSIAGQLPSLENPEVKTQIEQFTAFNSTLGVIDGWNTDGKRTYQEDIADLGGVLVAYDAWQATMKRQKKRRAASVDGLTPDQQFFISLGRVWRSRWSGASLSSDVHAAPFARVNAMAMQSPMFAKAFGCKPTDPMVLPAEKRATIW